VLRGGKGLPERLLKSHAGGFRAERELHRSGFARPRAAEEAAAEIANGPHTLGRGTASAIGRTRSSGRMSHVGSGTSSSS
jgi:hypothetical protein